MSTKRVIAISLIALSAGAILLKNKIDKLTKQFESISIIPAKLSNIKLIWNDSKPLVNFNIDLKFSNPLSEKFQVNGLVAKLQRIIILDKNGFPLGVATPNVGKITIPANGFFIIPNVPFVLDLKNTIINVTNYKLLTLQTLKFEAIISVLGYEYKIK